jgi:hypothetical protein
MIFGLGGMVCRFGHKELSRREILLKAARSGRPRALPFEEGA